MKVKKSTFHSCLRLSGGEAESRGEVRSGRDTVRMVRVGGHMFVGGGQRSGVVVSLWRQCFCLQLTVVE